MAAMSFSIHRFMLAIKWSFVPKDFLKLMDREVPQEVLASFNLLISSNGFNEQYFEREMRIATLPPNNVQSSVFYIEHNSFLCPRCSQDGKSSINPNTQCHSLTTGLPLAFVLKKAVKLTYAAFSIDNVTMSICTLLIAFLPLVTRSILGDPTIGTTLMEGTLCICCLYLTCLFGFTILSFATATFVDVKRRVCLARISLALLPHASSFLYPFMYCKRPFRNRITLLVRIRYWNEALPPDFAIPRQFLTKVDFSIPSNVTSWFLLRTVFQSFGRNNATRMQVKSTRTHAYICTK